MSKRMEVDGAHYDRLLLTHADRSCDYLHRCVNATIEKDRLVWLHAEATRVIGGEHWTAAGAVKGGDKGCQKSGKSGEKRKGKGKGDKKGGKETLRRDHSMDSTKSTGDKREVCKRHLLGEIHLVSRSMPAQAKQALFLL